MSVEEIKAFLVAAQKEGSNAMKLAENAINEATEFKKYCEEVLKKLNTIKESK